MKYRQKRQQDYQTPVYEFDQPKHRMSIISHAYEVRLGINTILALKMSVLKLKVKYKRLLLRELFVFY